MYDWKYLADQLKVLQTQQCVWPKNFDMVSQINWGNYNGFVLQQLLDTTEVPGLNDDMRVTRFHQFFEIQSYLYEKISDDPASFSFPCDIACALVAKTIAQPDQTVCQILRPRITRVIGSAVESDVKGASENEQGDFDPKEFLLNSSYTALIAIAPVLDAAAKKSKHLWRTDPLQSNDELYDLTSKDLANLCESAGEPSRNYFTTLEKIHRVHLERKPSLAWEFEKLRKALYESSKGMSGNETIADIEQCRKALIDFRHVWVSLSAQYISDEKSPDDKRSTKEKISDYIAGRNAAGKIFTIESYLLRLFSAIEEISHTTDENIAFTEAEKKILLAEETGEGIYPCTEQISADLITFLADNADLDNIPLPGHEADFENEPLPTAAELTTLSAALQTALLSRQPLNAHYDRASFLLPIFYIISKHFCRRHPFPEHVFTRIPELASYADSLEGVVAVLSLLPRNYWRHFISHYALEIANKINSDDRPSLFILFFLQSLSPSDWGVFIEPLFKNCGLTPLNAGYVSLLLFELPKLQWKTFYRAIGFIKKDIFLEVKDLQNFLVFPAASLAVNQWQERILLFRKEIARLFFQPLLFANLFIDISPRYWDLLAIALKPIFDQRLKDLATVSGIASRLHPELRLSFLNAILPQIPSACFQKEVDIAAFLSLFEKEEDQLTCLEDMYSYFPPDFRITASAACDLLKKYPQYALSIVRLFSDQFLDIFTELFSTFHYLSENKVSVPIPLNNMFIFLMENALPCIGLDPQVVENKAFFINLAHCQAITQQDCVEKMLCEQTTQTEAPNSPVQTPSPQTQSLPRPSFFHGASSQNRMSQAIAYGAGAALPTANDVPPLAPRLNRAMQGRSTGAIWRPPLDLSYLATSPRRSSVLSNTTAQMDLQPGVGTRH